jgi:hypothetical protein
MNIMPSAGDADAHDLYAVVKATRSPEYNRRICAHEIGHAYVARACGSVVEFVTAVPHDNFAGRCVRRGAPSASLNLVDDRKPAPPAPTTAQIVTICATIGAPEIGTPRVEDAEEMARAMVNIVELVAARVCERVFFSDLEPLPAAHDLVEARALASVIASPGAVEALLAYCEAEAEALIRAHLGVVKALVDALVELGTLIGEQVDEIIGCAIAAETLVAERARRRDEQQRVESAAKFRSETISHH